MERPENAPPPPRELGDDAVEWAKFLALGVVVFLCGSALALRWYVKTMHPLPSSPSVRKLADSASAFTGHFGYLIRLPKGYTVYSHMREAGAREEIVYFCPSGTDPSNFIDEGLFGPLGIVRLAVRKSPFSDTQTAAADLGTAVRRYARNRKHSLTPLTISSLRGFDLIVDDPPSPHVEVFLLGQSSLYVFFAGKDAPVLREILGSLNETKGEAW